MQRVNRLLLGGAAAVLTAHLALAHIRIAPTESTYGAREKYRMRVPNEKKVASIKVEGEFPAGLNVYDFEFKPGWKIEFKKDDKGKIIGATWTGRMEPYEFEEFGMLAINPKEGGDRFGSSSNTLRTGPKKNSPVRSVPSALHRW
jgi:uncharacterized protein YcnI